MNLKEDDLVSAVALVVDTDEDGADDDAAAADDRRRVDALENGAARRGVA